MKYFFIGVLAFLTPLFSHAAEVNTLALQEVSATLSRILVLLEALKVKEQDPLAVIPPDLKKVLVCESGLKHFTPAGKILMSPTKDAGIMQINVPIHRQTSLNLGYDIFTLEGNIGYGMHLYRTSGLRPWVCARILKMV